jgi:hypothetical protein
MTSMPVATAVALSMAAAVRWGKRGGGVTAAYRFGDLAPADST